MKIIGEVNRVYYYDWMDTKNRALKKVFFTLETLSPVQEMLERKEEGEESNRMLLDRLSSEERPLWIDLYIVTSKFDASMLDRGDEVEVEIMQQEIESRIKSRIKEIESLEPQPAQSPSKAQAIYNRTKATIIRPAKYREPLPPAQGMGVERGLKGVGISWFLAGAFVLLTILVLIIVAAHG